MRKHFGVFLALVLGIVLGLVGIDRARAVTFSGVPLSGTASVLSLSLTTTSAGVASAPQLFLAGTSGVNTAIQGGVFWSDATCVLQFTDGSGGATIGVLGITASVPLPVTPQLLGIGSTGQAGSGICTITKGAGIYLVCPPASGTSTIHVSWTGPVNQQ